MRLLVKRYFFIYLKYEYQSISVYIELILS